MNWQTIIEWVPSVVSILAYAAGQIIGHKQGRTTIVPPPNTPTKSTVPDIAQHVIDLVNAVNSEAQRAGTIAGAAANAASHCKTTQSTTDVMHIPQPPALPTNTGEPIL